jgi:N-acetyl-anhydromuramyl-L-alanine amidase AmpD
MIGKNPTSTSKNTGTIVEWLMRFWSPGAYESRWTGGSRAMIRQVTCRILQPNDTPEMNECWRLEYLIDSGSANIQPGLDLLAPGQLYALELAVPADSMYHSSGPAGPKTGRAKLDELPPWLNPNDVYDYQVRPARFWFDVEPAPDLDPPGMRIRVMHDDEENTSKRPAPARHQLRKDPKLPVNHVDVDWRPDWLRRGRNNSRKVDIHPSGGNDLHGGKPTYIVLHSIGVPDGKPVSIIGSAINTFLDNDDNGGVHYIVDVDGHVVKMCPDTRGLAHANTARWRDKEGLNRRSVGIEHAWTQPDVHPRAQIRATTDLVRAIKREFGIDGRNIAGHGEVRCISDDESLDSTAIRATPRTAEQQQRVKQIEDSKRAKLKAENERAKSKNQTDKIKTDAQIEAEVQSHVKSKNLGFDYDFQWGLALHPNSRLTSCPGRHFDWAYLATREIVPDPWREELPDGWKKAAYSGVFELDKDLELRLDDDDHGQVWGGAPRQWQAGSPVRELHDDLTAIGYTIPIGSMNDDGHQYTKLLEIPVKAFKARYMQDTIKKHVDGRVDVATAEMIKRVVAAYARGPI